MVENGYVYIFGDVDLVRSGNIGLGVVGVLLKVLVVVSLV